MAKREKPTLTQNKITSKDFKFAKLVLEGIKPEEAAIECGHKATAARMAACRLLDKPAIKAYIENERLRRLEQLRRETEVDDIWITKKFKEILDRCMQAQAVMRFDRERGEMVHARDDDSGQLLYVFDSAGAIKAAENLAKHIGYYELDNKQKAPVIKISATHNNINNFFFEDQSQQEAGIVGYITEQTGDTD